MELTVEEIKETRGKYGLSQRAFADALGIGSASIARYERGATPSKANANLIRAAANPEFMMDCVKRDGSALTQEQRDSVTRVYYACVTLPQEDERTANAMNETYDLTLKQEVLNEQAANLIGEIISLKAKDGLAGKAVDVFNDVLDQIAYIKPTIVSSDSMNDSTLSEIEGFLKCAEALLKHQKGRVLA